MQPFGIDLAAFATIPDFPLPFAMGVKCLPERGIKVGVVAPGRK